MRGPLSREQLTAVVAALIRRQGGEVRIPIDELAEAESLDVTYLEDTVTLPEQIVFRADERKA